MRPALTHPTGPQRRPHSSVMAYALMHISAKAHRRSSIVLDCRVRSTHDKSLPSIPNNPNTQLHHQHLHVSVARDPAVVQHCPRCPNGCAPSLESRTSVMTLPTRKCPRKDGVHVGVGYCWNHVVMSHSLRRLPGSRCIQSPVLGGVASAAVNVNFTFTALNQKKMHFAAGQRHEECTSGL